MKMKKAIPILLLIVLFGGAGWYFFTEEPEPVHELPLPQPLPAEPEPAPQPEPEPEDISAQAEPEPVIIPDPLPELNESDPQFTQALAEIVGAESLEQYLVKSDVISRFVTMIDGLTSRQVSPQVNPVRPAAGNFKVLSEGERVVLSPENFTRYDGYVSLLDGVDTDVLLALYQRYDPLFQQAWEDNGRDGSFDQRLAEVIDELLATPDVPGSVYLTKPEAVYVFEQSELESMTAGQKILLRMGSANATVVKEKLAEIRLRIDNG